MYPSSFGQLCHDETNQKRFQNSTAKLLRTVKNAFPGLQTHVTKNRGGIAVGGEVYLRLEDAEKQRGVLVTVAPCGFSDRPDGVTCYLQHRLPDTRGKLTRLPVNVPNRTVEISENAIIAGIHRLLNEVLV